MKNNKIYQILETLSMLFILSYFSIHNIFLVFIGITISLYLININFINNLIKLFNKKFLRKELTMNSTKNIKPLEPDLKQIKFIKDNSQFTLVEKIEELGFIPSIDKEIEDNAA